LTHNDVGARRGDREHEQVEGCDRDQRAKHAVNCCNDGFVNVKREFKYPRSK
jgi:hypothetical protein